MFQIFQIVSKTFHCKKGDVAVYEYANSTSAHDTVLEPSGACREKGQEPLQLHWLERSLGFLWG